jgi:acetyl esterase/lipase
MRFFLSTFLVLLISNSILAQEFIPLWPNKKMPNSKGIVVKDSIYNERQFHVGKPGIYAFFTSKQENKNAAVLIIPGGGYSRLAFDISGFQLAKWYNTLGINAFVLIHRLPHSIDLKEREKGPLQDAQRAMKIIRKNAELWKIDLNKVGAMGSSAGGHLVASLGTIKDDFSNINDEFDPFDFKPNFMVLVSAVIDMESDKSKGIRENLMGSNPSKEKIQKYSLQYQVGSHTPQTFLVQAFNDRTVPAQEHCMLFYQKLLEYKIPSSLHVFNQGAHAIALRNNPGSANLWTSVCEKWLEEIGIIQQK